MNLEEIAALVERTKAALSQEEQAKLKAGSGPQRADPPRSTG